MALFLQVTYHLSSSLLPTVAAQLETLLQLNGATRAAGVDDPRLTHVVAESYGFEGWERVVRRAPGEVLGQEGAAQNGEATTSTGDAEVGKDVHGRRVEVVTPKWVERSVVLGKIQPEIFFSADPAMLFSGVCACSTELPSADLETLSAGITALGGQWRASLTKEITHLFAVSPDSAKYAAAMHYRDETGIRVVLPHWFDDVVKLGVRGLGEEPYEWPDPGILRGPDGLDVSMGRDRDRDRAKDKDKENVPEVQSQKEKVKRNMYATAHLFTQPMNRSSPPTEKDITLATSASVALPTSKHPPHASASSNGNASILSALGVGADGGAGVQNHVWAGRKILLSRTLQLYRNRHEAVRVNVERAGGVVLRYEGDDEDGDVFEGGQRAGEDQGGLYEKLTKREKMRRRREAELVEECDVLVTRWRYGRAYVQAVREAKTVGTLAWLFHVQSTGIFSRPLDQILHYPIPKRPIDGFEHHVITVTNYTGEAREYLKKLIMAMGASFTPSMSGQNTALVAAYIHGTKATKALSWSIPVVNHTWLEDCFIQWRNLTPANIKYIHFPPGVDFSRLLGERGIHAGGELGLGEGVPIEAVAGAGGVVQGGVAQGGMVQNGVGMGAGEGVLVNGHRHDIHLGFLGAGGPTREQVMGRIEGEAEELAEMGDDLSDAGDEQQDVPLQGPEGGLEELPHGTEQSMKEVAGLVDVTIADGDGEQHQEAMDLDLDLERSPGGVAYEPNDDPLMDFDEPAPYGGGEEDEDEDVQMEVEEEPQQQEEEEEEEEVRPKKKTPAKSKTTSKSSPAKPTSAKPTPTKAAGATAKVNVNGKTPTNANANANATSKTKTTPSSGKGKGKAQAKAKPVAVSDVSSAAEDEPPAPARGRGREAPKQVGEVIELDDSDEDGEEGRVKVASKANAKAKAQEKEREKEKERDKEKETAKQKMKPKMKAVVELVARTPKQKEKERTREVHPVSSAGPDSPAAPAAAVAASGSKPKPRPRPRKKDATPPGSDQEDEEGEEEEEVRSMSPPPQPVKAAKAAKDKFTAKSKAKDDAAAAQAKGKGKGKKVASSSEEEDEEEEEVEPRRPKQVKSRRRRADEDEDDEEPPRPPRKGKEKEKEKEKKAQPKKKPAAPSKHVVVEDADEDDDDDDDDEDSAPVVPIKKISPAKPLSTAAPTATATATATSTPSAGPSTGHGQGGLMARVKGDARTRVVKKKNKAKAKAKEPTPESEGEGGSEGEHESDEEGEVEVEEHPKRRGRKAKEVGRGVYKEVGSDEDGEEEPPVPKRKGAASKTSPPKAAASTSTSKSKSAAKSKKDEEEPQQQQQQARKGRSKPMRVYSDAEEDEVDDEEEEEEEEEEEDLPPAAESDDSDDLPAVPLQRSKAEKRAEDTRDTRKGKEKEKSAASTGKGKEKPDKPATYASAKGKGKRKGKRGATPVQTESEEEEGEVVVPTRKAKAAAAASAGKATPLTPKRTLSVLLPSLELSPEKVRAGKNGVRESGSKGKEVSKSRGKAKAKEKEKTPSDDDGEVEEVEPEPEPPKPKRGRPPKKDKDKEVAGSSAPPAAAAAAASKAKAKPKPVITSRRHPSSVESEDEDEEEEVSAIVSAARPIPRTESIRAVAGQAPAAPAAAAGTPSKSVKAKGVAVNGHASTANAAASSSKAPATSATASAGVKPKPKAKPRRDQETPMDVDQSAPASITDDASISAAAPPPRRSAAAKANQRLHDTIMPDLLQYEAQRKKAGKGASSSHAFTMNGDDAEGERRKKRASHEDGDGEPDIEKPKKRRRVSEVGSADEAEIVSKPAMAKGKGKQKTVEDDAMDVDGDGKRPGEGIVIMTTQVSLKDDVIKTLNKLGVKITTRPNECTHLIASNLVRTEKFLCALASRAPWIVTEKWAIKCAEAKKILPEKDFVLKDKAGESRYGVVLAESLKRSKALAGRLLEGHTFYVTPKVPVDAKLLKNVVTACGGQLTTQTPTVRIINAAPTTRHVISCKDDIAIWRPLAAQGIKIYTQELVLTGALAQDVQWDKEEFWVSS